MAAPDLVPVIKPFVENGLLIALSLALSAAGGFLATRFVPRKSRELRKLVYGLVSFVMFSGSVLLFFATTFK